MFMEADMSSGTPEFIIQNTVVRAGAGAGKTTRLVEEVINQAQTFYRQKQEWPRMVLTTFTRKATQELRERLILQACKAGDQELLEYLSSNSYLQVSTIHGILSLFLRRYGHLVGLDNGYSVITDQEADREAKKIVRDLAVEHPQVSELMSLFGLKKLSHLLRRLSGLYFEFPEAHFVTEDELRGYWETHCQTIAMRVHEVISELREATSEPKFVEYADTVEQALSDLFPSQEDTSRQIGLVLDRLPARKPPFSKKNPPYSEELDERLKKAIARLKKDLTGPELSSEHWKVARQWFEKLELVGRLFHERFSGRKKILGQFEMTDLESVTVDVLRTHPELGDAFASDFDFWLIDEFQDTSPVQVELLKRLVGDRPTFIVGDPQQSIYLFRGARSEVFHQQEQLVESSGGKLEEKKKNWRSEPELLEFFNEFFKNFTSSFISMEPRDPVQNPEKLVATFCPISGEQLESDEDMQYHAIGERVKSLLEQGAEPEEICILGRTNAQLFDMAHYLRFHGFPTHLHVSSGFYQRREVMDAMALLRFLVSPHDNKNLIMLLRSPWCRVKDDVLAKNVFGRHGSYWSHLENASELNDNEVICQLKKLREMRSQFGITFSFERALIDFGCIDFSHHHDVSGRRESNFWKLLSRLKEEEKKPGFSFLKFVNRSFAELDTENGNEESDAVAALEPNHIQLMTIHSSKGLQFPHVILPDIHKAPRAPRTPLVSVDEKQQCWSATLPLGDNGDNMATVADLCLKEQRRQLENKESERVLYVALTRAKSSVFLSWEGEAQEGSWLSQLKWNLKPGIHRFENFSYEVLEKDFKAVEYRQVNQQVVKIREAYSQQGGSPRPQKFSVTSLVEESSKPASGSATPSRVVPERIKKAVEGVLVHRMMEILKTHWDFDFESVAPMWFGEDADRFLSAVEWARGQKQLPLKEIIQNGHTEWGYQLLKDNRIIEGQVDLWGLVNGCLWIVDYKTGSQKYQDQAFTQLRLYAEALSFYENAENIKMCVIYPMDQVIKVQDY